MMGGGRWGSVHETSLRILLRECVCCSSHYLAVACFPMTRSQKTDHVFRMKSRPSGVTFCVSP
ncbi:unnamed protein product [Laminaria digitata]